MTIRDCALAVSVRVTTRLARTLPPMLISLSSPLPWRSKRLSSYRTTMRSAPPVVPTTRAKSAASPTSAPFSYSSASPSPLTSVSPQMSTPSKAAI